MGVDFEEINRNIKKENLDIRLIRILYEELNEFEENEIIKYQKGDKLDSEKVMSRYPKDLNPMYKEKAKGVIYLGG